MERGAVAGGTCITMRLAAAAMADFGRLLPIAAAADDDDQKGAEATIAWGDSGGFSNGTISSSSRERCAAAVRSSVLTTALQPAFLRHGSPQREGYY